MTPSEFFGGSRGRLILLGLLALAACAERADQLADSGRDTAAPPQVSLESQDSLVLASGENYHPTQEVDEADVQQATNRRMTDTSWRERWKRGGGREDTLLRSPTFMAADAEMVYVLDRDPHAVVAIRMADGTVAWHSDTVKSERFGYLRDIAIRPNGEVVILDDRRILHRVSPQGEWRTPIPLAGRWSPHTLCVPDDTSFVIYTLDVRDPLVRLDTLGRVLERYPVPWEDLRDATSIETQSRLATGPGGMCVVALTLGRGFATMHGPSVGVRQPYVEAVKLPTAIQTTWKVNGQQARRARLPRNQPRGAVSVAVRDSTIMMLFGGLSEERYRVIDTYELVRGTYRESWRLPIRARAITVAPGLLLVLGTSAGYPTLLALTAR